MNEDQLLRYSRHILLKDFDYEKQQQLLDAKVLIVGLGGLGCPVAMYLAAAGVGELWLADFDKVELSNLQRQIAHGTDDIGQLKVTSANDEIKRLNNDITVHCINEKLQGQSLIDTVMAVDVVVDASDNFSTRFELNRVCVNLKKPLVSGAAIRSEGQVIVFDSRQPESPCYRCLYDDTDDSQLNCSDSGVLAPLVGVIGSVQALEVIKVITGFGESLLGQLMIFDAKTMDWRKLKVSKNPECPVCSGQ
jgi:adenylyltransferase/sulfurtransferase